MFILSSNLITTSVISFAVGVVLIPVLKRFSEEKNALIDVAEGDALKIHKKPIPLLGGPVMIVSFVVGMVLMTSWSSSGGVILGAIIIFCLGLLDDVVWKHVSSIRPLLKFALLIFCSLAAAGMVLWNGRAISPLIENMTFLPWGLIIFLPTLLLAAYIFILMNAVNYQDGMDGLAGGLTVISLVGFIVLSVAIGNGSTMILSSICMAAVLSFMVYNFPPAKIFMGDSGAYLLGFLLSVISASFLSYSIISIIGSILIIGLPIIDGVFTNIRRLAAGKSIFLGDRSHFYDRLLQKGFSTKKTLAICYCLQAVCVIVGIGLMSFN